MPPDIHEPDISALIPCFNTLPGRPVPPTPATNAALAQLVKIIRWNVLGFPC